MTTTRKPQKRTGGERRGNNTDRARRRVFLLAHWGTGTACQCVWCGAVVRDVPAEQSANGECHPEHLSVDRIVPGEDGPGYIRSNIVPACNPCNGKRNDRPFDSWSEDGVDTVALRDHATRSPKRGIPK